MKVNVEARYYQSGDEDQIVEVLKSSFPDWARRKDPVTYWRWKYIDTPHGAGIEVVIVDGNIICVNHRVNLEVKVLSEVLLSQYGDDAATSPDFRGKGYYDKLVKLEIDYKVNHGIAFFYSVPANPIIIKINTRKGLLNTPFRVRELIRILDVGLYVKQKNVKNLWLIRLGFPILKLYNRLLSLLHRSKKHEGDFRIDEIKTFGGEFDALWDSVKSSNDFIVEKSSRYLNWRYSPIAGDYKIFAALDGVELLGYVVSEVKSIEDFREGFIDDVLFKAGREDVGEALIKSALGHLDSLGVNVTNFVLVKGGLGYNLALRNGFIDLTISSNLPMSVGYTDSTRNVELKDLDHTRIHFTYGDFQF